MSKLFAAFRPLIYFSLLFLLQAPAVAQETAIQSAKPANITINGINPSQIPEIYVTVSVTDDFGRSLRNLQLEDFTLTGELANLARLTAVENITDDDLSYAVVLALDISKSMSGQPIAALKEAAKTFLSIIGENDPVALMAFNHEVRVVQDFTVDKIALRAAIDALEAGGQTALYQAGLAAVELAANAPTSRRAIIILSDGHEYGNASQAAREDAQRASLIRGVPVYTIGLGYDQVDRDYLKELAAAGFGIFSESPTPEELVQRYSDFALLFRSQYILTIEADLPLDGRLYSLGLALGGLAVESERVSLRTPIPVPIISLTSASPSQPIAEPIEFRFRVAADDPLQEVRLNLDGINIPTRMEDAEYSATLHPVELLPGAHELEIAARDEDGDYAEFNWPFTVAALPPEITLESPLLQDPLLAETTAISVTTGGQTPFARAKVVLDGVTQTSSNEEPSLLLDPYAFQPGPHELQFIITNEGEQSTSASIPFEVPALPPIFRLEGLSNRETLSDFAEIFIDLNKSQAGGDIQSRYRVNDAPAIPLVGDEGLTLSARELSPGTNRITVTIEDSNTGLTSEQTIQFEVPTLKPEVQVSGLAEGDTLREDRRIDLAVESQTEVLRAVLKIDGEEVQRRREPPYQFDLAALDLPPGEHTAEIQVVNEGLREEIEVIPFTVAVEPAQTATQQARATAIQQSVARAVEVVRATQQARATATQQAAATATQQATQLAATQQARATAIQQSVAQAVEIVRATQQTRATATQQTRATATQQTAATATQQTRATATQQTRATATQQTRATATQQTVATATQQAAATATQQTAATATQQTRATATQQTAATATQQAAATATQQTAATATQQTRTTATQQTRATATQQAAQLAATATQQAVQLAATATQQAATATQQARATATQQIRATAAQLAATATQQAAATATQQAAATVTPMPSPTPRPTLAEIEVAPPSEPADNTPILVVTIIVLLLLSAAFYLLRNRSNRN